MKTERTERLKEAELVGKSWFKLKTIAANRVRPQHVVDALCSTRRYNEEKKINPNGHLRHY